MKFLKLAAKLFFFSAFIFCFDRLEEVCDSVGPTFRFIDDLSVNYHYNLKESFETGYFLGSGGFGVVRKAVFNFKGIAEIAIKEMTINEFTLTEINSLYNFSKLGVGPTFYFCQIFEKKIYIAQEIFEGDLYSKLIVSKVLQFKVSEYIELVLDIVEKLSVMWNENYIHNDIKDENIMLSKTTKPKAELIDFGLVQSRNQYVDYQGTPIFLSPAKWNSLTDGDKIFRLKVKDLNSFGPNAKEWYNRPRSLSPHRMPKEVDDLYALAIVFASVCKIDGASKMEKDFDEKTNTYSRLDGKCFEIRFGQDCHQILISNAKNFFTEANLGFYHTSPELTTKEKINFTTLMTKMVEYDDFDFSYSDVKGILERIIQEFRQIESSSKSTFVQKIKDNTYANDDIPDYYDFDRRFPLIPKVKENAFLSYKKVAEDRATWKKQENDQEQNRRLHEFKNRKEFQQKLEIGKQTRNIQQQQINPVVDKFNIAQQNLAEMNVLLDQNKQINYEEEKTPFFKKAKDLHSGQINYVQKSNAPNSNAENFEKDFFNFDNYGNKLGINNYVPVDKNFEAYQTDLNKQVQEKHPMQNEYFKDQTKANENKQKENFFNSVFVPQTDDSKLVHLNNNNQANIGIQNNFQSQKNNPKIIYTLREILDRTVNKPKNDQEQQFVKPIPFNHDFVLNKPQIDDQNYLKKADETIIRTAQILKELKEKNQGNNKPILGEEVKNLENQKNPKNKFGAQEIKQKLIFPIENKLNQLKSSGKEKTPNSRFYEKNKKELESSENLNLNDEVGPIQLAKQFIAESMTKMKARNPIDNNKILQTQNKAPEEIKDAQEELKYISTRMFLDRNPIDRTGKELTVRQPVRIFDDGKQRENQKLGPDKIKMVPNSPNLQNLKRTVITKENVLKLKEYTENLQRGQNKIAEMNENLKKNDFEVANKNTNNNLKYRKINSPIPVGKDKRTPKSETNTQFGPTQTSIFEQNSKNIRRILLQTDKSKI